MRRRFSYANVMATVAVFIALGGTSYAVATLPRNSVGAKQIRTNAVGHSEVRTGAIRSSDLHNGSVSLKDLASKTRTALRGRRGATGPAGPPGTAPIPYAAAVDAGAGVRSNTGGHLAEDGHLIGSGLYNILFDRDMTSCYAVASLSSVPGSTPVTPENGETVTQTTSNGVIVRTRNSSGGPTDLPFHVIVVC
jgi:hypothetical protein